MKKLYTIIILTLISIPNISQAGLFKYPGGGGGKCSCQCMNGQKVEVCPPGVVSSGNQCWGTSGCY